MDTFIFTLGIHSRFWYYKAIKKPKSMEYLSGSKNVLNHVDQMIPNIIVGFLVFIPIVLICVYFAYSIF